MNPTVPTWSESRRQITAMSVLDWIALFCLGASLLFWGVLYFTLIAPPLPQLAPQTFVALALTVMSALIIPLFWSIDVIKLMRDWLLREGLGTPSIATKLTRMGIPTPGARVWNSTEWNAAGVYRILTSPSIAGAYYHGRYRRAKRGDKYARKTDPSEWNALPCKEIISPEEFEAIGKKLKDNRELSRRNTKCFYLLGRRIKCSCGSSLTGDNHGVPRRRIYRCVASQKVSPKICKPFNSVRADRTQTFQYSSGSRKLHRADPVCHFEALIAESRHDAQRMRPHVESADPV